METMQAINGSYTVLYTGSGGRKRNSFRGLVGGGGSSLLGDQHLSAFLLSTKRGLRRQLPSSMHPLPTREQRRVMERDTKARCARTTPLCTRCGWVQVSRTTVFAVKTRVGQTHGGCPPEGRASRTSRAPTAP